ncbi:small acid-soluble spore protein Tlp [Sediminibacillus massiliensis]|uniref:small acid-soluble spore protein Tlp n=1 Tax=Sediminibacillus massiliensis TaxID=1926277 RepID=UPI003CCB9669
MTFMREHNTQPNPDNREDNVEKLQEMVQNTIENLEASHDTMKFASGEEKEQIKAKNARREESIRGLRQEIKDEFRHQQGQ